MTTDPGELIVLLLLDLTVALDAVDHEILIGWLVQWTGLSGEALQWMWSYLIDRSFCWGFLPGPFLGPLLFSIDLLTLGILFRKHKANFNLYADECQIDVPKCKRSDLTIIRVIDCLAKVTSWMSANFLGLNESQTEVLTPSGRKDHGLDLLSLAPFEQSRIYWSIENLGK
uniref:Reverse transcriptase domain-containing protein n=1 Tax=Oryzias latipes TaxID=8090 RepID=A0A3P9LHI0_ORYLA